MPTHATPAEMHAAVKTVEALARHIDAMYALLQSFAEETQDERDLNAAAAWLGAKYLTDELWGGGLAHLAKAVERASAAQQQAVTR